MSTDIRFTADRRAFMIGLGAAATFAPLAASPAASLGAAASLSAAPVGAVFWGLPYTDFTGTAAPYRSPARRADASGDADPHAQLIALA